MNEPEPTKRILDPESPVSNNNSASASPDNSLTPDHKPSKKLAIIIGAVILVAITTAAIIFLSKDESRHNSQLNKTSQPTTQGTIEQKAVEQVFIHPVNNSKTAIKKEDYYAVTANGTEYYGRVSKINDDYVRLSPTAYQKAGVVTFAGKELHGPESATYFKVSNITKFQELTDAAILEAVKAADSTVSDAFPSNDINKYVKSGQFQAYFFADGTALFAKTTNLAGAFLANASHVYVLQTSGPAGAHQQISLALAQPEQFNKRTADSLLYWQNMKSDSQIAKAAAAFEKNQ